MDSWTNKPLGFGEVLDVSFRIVKENFGKLFTIMLILTGPIYLIQGLAMLFSGVPAVRSTIEESEGVWLESFLTNLEQSGDPLATVGDPFSLLVVALLSIVLYPVATAAIIFFVNQLKEGKAIQLGDVMKQSFRRYGALLGGTIVYFLALLPVYIVSVIIVVWMVSVVSLQGSLFLAVLVGLITFGGIFILVSYFSIRWGFYFPAVVFEKVSPGLGKSWRLTKKRFWPLLGLLIVLMIITTVIAWVFEVVITLILGASVLQSYLLALVYMALMAINIVTYSVVFFDLRVRNEAVDLKDMVDTYEHRMDSQHDQADSPIHKEEGGYDNFDR